MHTFLAQHNLYVMDILMSNVPYSLSDRRSVKNRTEFRRGIILVVRNTMRNTSKVIILLANIYLTHTIPDQHLPHQTP